MAIDGGERWIGWRLISLISGRRPAIVARIASFADQGLQGVANVAANLILARALTHDQFATVGVMIGVHFFAWGLHRSVVVLPFILNASEVGAKDSDADAWWWINLAVVVAIGVMFSVIASAMHLAGVGIRSSWLVHAVGLSAIVSPWLCTIEFARRRLYQRGRAITAAAASGVYAVILVGTAVAVLLLGHNPDVGAFAWALAGAGGTLWATATALPHRQTPANVLAVWKSHRQFAFWQAMTSIPYSLYTTGVVVLVGAFSGAGAAAAFAAARTLTNPAMAAVSAVDTLDKPRAARALANAGVEGFAASIRKTRWTVILVTGPYLAMIAIFAPYIVHLAFGASYAADSFGVRIVAVGFFLTGLNQPSETALIVLRAGKLMFAIRLAAALIAIVGLAIGGRLFGFVGCAVAVLLTNLFNVVALHLAERRVDGLNPA